MNLYKFNYKWKYFWKNMFSNKNFYCDCVVKCHGIGYPHWKNQLFIVNGVKKMKL